MKTAQTIEELGAAKISEKLSGKSPRKKKYNSSPAQLANLVAPWTSENHPRLGGRPKNDVSKEIARKAFENNKEKIYEAYAAALMSGNAYAFSVLSERGYGKLKETADTNPLSEIPDGDLNEQIAALLQRLGLTADIDGASRAGIAAARAPEAAKQEQDSDLLPGNGSTKTGTV